jgi:signal transduction histidine kinase
MSTHWWRRSSVQVRSAIAATCVLAVLLTSAATVLVVLLRRSLVEGVDQADRARAAAIAAEVVLTPDGLGLRPGTGLRSAVDASAARRSWVQVLDGTGTVLARSADVRGQPALVALRPGPGQVFHVDQRFPFDEDVYRVIARGGTSGGHPFLVFVGQSLGPVDDTIQTIVTLLGAGIPLLLSVLGGATYIFARNSLRPVEAIRETVASITDRDLSERVTVPPADDAVSRLARTMNAMLERLERAQEAQRQFVADASHELRSPIATLATTAEIAVAHPDPRGSSEFAAGVLDESRRLQRLVENLLLLARADERGLVPAQLRDIDLDELAGREEQRLNSISRLTVVVRLSHARASGDPHQLEQAIRNLVDNAAQHALSRVELSVYQDDGDAVLEVFNDGPRIAAADRERIFERFVRLEESRSRRTGGSGLGLAIVREIMSAHGGSVSAIDDPDGARFRLVVPASRPE